MLHFGKFSLIQSGGTTMFQTFLTLWLVANFIMVECQYPKDCCAVLKKNPNQQNTVTWISPDGKNRERGECDMQTDNGGWTVIQRRYFDRKRSFNEDWPSYENGFGNVDSQTSYWRGLKHIQRWTDKKDQAVRFDMEDFDGIQRFAKYNKFVVHVASENYKLDIGDYDPASTAGDSLTNATNLSRFNVNGMPFSTFEKGKDNAGNCANNYRGAWWWNCCGDAHPNGIHHNSRTFDYSSITWKTFDGYNSLRNMRISIRNKDKTKCGAK